MYKIVGSTGKGRCGCGHMSYSGKDYWIRRVRSGKSEYLMSMCKACVDPIPKAYQTIEVPGDLVEGVIPIR